MRTSVSQFLYMITSIHSCILHNAYASLPIGISEFVTSLSGPDPHRVADSDLLSFLNVHSMPLYILISIQDSEHFLPTALHMQPTAGAAHFILSAEESPTPLPLLYVNVVHCIL